MHGGGCSPVECVCGGGSWPARGGRRIWGIRGWEDFRPLHSEVDGIGPPGQLFNWLDSVQLRDEADQWVHDGQMVVKSMILVHFEANFNPIFNARLSGTLKYNYCRPHTQMFIIRCISSV